MGRNLVFLLVVVFLVLVESVFFCVVSFSASRRSRTWELTEDKFKDTVVFAVSNFLSSVVLTSSVPGTGVSRPSEFPKYKSVDGLVVWFSPVRGYCCRIGSNEFVPGDYCEFGLVLRISQGRVFVRDPESNVVILRPGIGAGVAPATAAPGRAEESRL